MSARGSSTQLVSSAQAAVIVGSFYLTRRIAAREEELRELDIPAIVEAVYCCAGYGTDVAGVEWKPVPQGMAVLTQLCIGPFAEREREARHLSDDQAICVGYPNALPETNHLPPAQWLARRIAKTLFELRTTQGTCQVGPDGKVFVRVETDGAQWRPASVSISLNHHEAATGCSCAASPRRRWSVPAGAAHAEHPTQRAGMFVAGGPIGDNGLSGKKLVVDAYGPTVPIGGGAWSGKDFH